MSLKHSDKSEELKTIPSKSWRILKECFRNPKEWQEMFWNPKNPSWREIFIYLNSPWLTSLNLFFIIHFRFVVWVCDWILRVLFFFPGEKKIPLRHFAFIFSFFFFFYFWKKTMLLAVIWFSGRVQARCCCSCWRTSSSSPSTLTLDIYNAEKCGNVSYMTVVCLHRLPV